MNDASELIDQLKSVTLSKGFRQSSVDLYAAWVQRFLRFSNKPVGLLCDEDIRLFLEYLTEDRKVSFSTRRSALTAMIFLFENILHQDVKHVRAFRLR